MKQFRSTYFGTLFAALVACAMMATSMMPAMAAEADSEGPRHDSEQRVSEDVPDNDLTESIVVNDKPVIVPDTQTGDVTADQPKTVVEATQLLPADQSSEPNVSQTAQQPEGTEEELADLPQTIPGSQPTPTHVITDKDGSTVSDFDGDDSADGLLGQPVEPGITTDEASKNTDDVRDPEAEASHANSDKDPVEPQEPQTQADAGTIEPTVPSTSVSDETINTKSVDHAEAGDDTTDETSAPKYSEAPMSLPQTSGNPDETGGSQYREAPTELPSDIPPTGTIETRPPPIVGPPPEEFVLPPIPTMDEWKAGKQYMYQDCLDHYKIDDDLFAMYLTGDPEYSSVFEFAWSCFRFGEFDQRIYPSYQRPSVDPDKPADPTQPTPGGEDDEQPGGSSSSPTQPAIPTVTLPPATPSHNSAHSGVHNGHNNRPGTSTKPQASPAPTSASQPWGSQFESPVVERDGVRYVRPWSPPQAFQYQPLAVGEAFQVMSSSTFADPLHTQAEAERLAPAGPDAVKIDDFLMQMGLTAIDIPWTGTGTALAITGDSDGTGPGKKVTYDVQVEGLMPVDRPVFVSKFQELLDKDTRYRFQRRSSGDTDITFIVASPSMTWQLCEPDAEPIDKPKADTPEPQNCVTDKQQVVINLRMWAFGDSGKPADSGEEKMSRQAVKDLQKYRQDLLKESVDEAFEADR